MEASACCAGDLWLLAEIRLAAPSGKQILARPLARMTQHEARTFCQQQGGALATILSSADNQFILSDILAGLNRSVWIGLGTPGGVPNSNPASWLWASSNQPAGYTNWGAGEPRDYAPMQGQCAVVLPSGNWQSLPCNRTAGVVCQLGEWGCSALVAASSAMHAVLQQR